MKSEQRGKRIEEDADLDLEKEKTHCERKEETARAAAATGDGRTRRQSRLLEGWADLAAGSSRQQREEAPGTGEMVPATPRGGGAGGCVPVYESRGDWCGGCGLGELGNGESGGICHFG